MSFKANSSRRGSHLTIEILSYCFQLEMSRSLCMKDLIIIESNWRESCSLILSHEKPLVSSYLNKDNRTRVLMANIGERGREKPNNFPAWQGLVPSFNVNGTLFRRPFWTSQLTQVSQADVGSLGYSTFHGLPLDVGHGSR